jgi:flagellar basal-body rod protein FlgF
MDRMIFLAMTGARETLTAQAVQTNNLANVNTTGFRADLETFTSMPVSGPGHASRVYAMDHTPTVDLRPGPAQQTGRNLDVAIDGRGWLAVQAPDGGEAYTRAGDLRIDTLGQLTTGTGLPLLGEGGPVAVPPYERIEIAVDGTISIQPVGGTPNTLVVVDRIKLVDPAPETLTKGEDGLIRIEGGGEAPADASVRVFSGMIEGSNVNGIDAMVRLIELSRQFELEVKMMKAAEENDRQAAQLMRMS